MSRARRTLRVFLKLLGAVAVLVGVFWAGYRFGADQEDRSVRILRILEGSGKSAKWTYLRYYNLFEPRDAWSFLQEQRRLDAEGIRYEVMQVKVWKSYAPIEMGTSAIGKL